MADVRVNISTYENAGTFRLYDLYKDEIMERGLDYFDMPQEMVDRYNRVMAEYEQLMNDMGIIYKQQTSERYKKSSWLKRQE